LTGGPASNAWGPLLERRVCVQCLGALQRSAQLAAELDDLNQKLRVLVKQQQEARRQRQHPQEWHHQGQQPPPLQQDGAQALEYTSTEQPPVPSAPSGPSSPPSAAIGQACAAQAEGTSAHGSGAPAPSTTAALELCEPHSAQGREESPSGSTPASAAQPQPELEESPSGSTPVSAAQPQPEAYAGACTPAPWVAARPAPGEGHPPKEPPLGTGLESGWQEAAVAVDRKEGDISSAQQTLSTLDLLLGQR
jgi:hypothetical protein